MKAPLVVFLICATVAAARETRDLTNLEGKTIHAEILDLNDKGMLKVLVKGMAFEVPVANLSDADKEWIALWDMKRKLGEEGAYYRKEIFADDFSADGFGERWAHYKSGSVVKGGVLVGITPEGSDHSAVDIIRFDPETDVSLDGEEAGAFQSEGVAHDHKTVVSLTTNAVDVEYDDFRIKAGVAEK